MALRQRLAAAGAIMVAIAGAAGLGFAVFFAPPAQRIPFWGRGLLCALSLAAAGATLALSHRDSAHNQQPQWRAPSLAILILALATGLSFAADALNFAPNFAPDPDNRSKPHSDDANLAVLDPPKALPVEHVAISAKGVPPAPAAQTASELPVANPLPTAPVQDAVPTHATPISMPTLYVYDDVRRPKEGDTENSGPYTFTPFGCDARTATSRHFSCSVTVEGDQSMFISRTADRPKIEFDDNTTIPAEYIALNTSTTGPGYSGKLISNLNFSDFRKSGIKVEAQTVRDSFLLTISFPITDVEHVSAILLKLGPGDTLKRFAISQR